MWLIYREDENGNKMYYNGIRIYSNTIAWNLEQSYLISDFDLISVIEYINERSQFKHQPLFKYSLFPKSKNTLFPERIN